jgi:large subunit ribosomal protein L18
MNHERSIRKIRERRKARIRARLFGTSERPRISVFRSNRYLAVQAIDDGAQRTIASASTRTIKEKGAKATKAEKLATLIAGELKKKGIASVVFDKGPYAYHGRVRAVAEGLRKEGMQF